MAFPLLLIPVISNLLGGGDEDQTQPITLNPPKSTTTKDGSFGIILMTGLILLFVVVAFIMLKKE